MATALDYDPIDLIRGQIAEATSLPEPEPYVPSSDPLERLRAHLRGESAQSPANDDRAAATSEFPTADFADSADVSLEALIGREVLAIVGSRPLKAEARAEAIRRLAIALQNPSRDNIRAVLAVLISE